MFKLAKKWGLIPENPTMEIEPLENKLKERGILTLHEAIKLLNPDTIQKVWNNQIIVYGANFVSAVTGMRQGEILALRSENVFKDYIEVKHSYERNYGLKGTKTGKTRFALLIPQAAQILNDLMEINKGFIFSMDGGKRPIYEKNLTIGLYSASSPTDCQQSVYIYRWFYGLRIM